MNFKIRNYCFKDLEEVYEICLKTGYAGYDASKLYQDPKLLGHIYVGPYVKLEPSSAFVLEYNSQLCGYIIGTLDSKNFYNKVDLEWLPDLRKKYKMPQKTMKHYCPDEKIIYSFYFPEKPIDYPEYPAHLHINITPLAQGRGMGIKMMDYFFKYLRQKNVKGLYLGVDIENSRAIKFYREYGLVVIKENIGSLIMGIKL